MIAIVANYNQLSTLPLVLESFAMQTILPKRVIVADDGSCDGSLEWLDSLPSDYYPYPFYYTTERHNGYGLTVNENRGALKSGPGRLLFTNADVVHSPKSIESHTLASKKDLIIGGNVREIKLPFSQQVNINSIRNFDVFKNKYASNLTSLSNGDFMLGEPLLNFYGIWGGNFSIDSFRFRELNGFNEVYNEKYGGEEADLIQRFLSLGGSVEWARESFSYHLAHKSKEYRSKEAGILKYREDYLCKR